MQIGHRFLAKPSLVFSAVDVGIDFSVVTLLLQDGEVVEHLRLVLGGTPQQMLEVELDETVGVGIGKETVFVETTFGHLAHKFPQAQVAAAEERFRPIQPLTGHITYWRPRTCW